MCEFDPRCNGGDDLIGHALAQIVQGRWAVTAVFGDEVSPPMAYTTGLTEFGRPELMITGLDAELSGRLLNLAAQRVIDDPTIGGGTHLARVIREPYELAAVDVAHTATLRVTQVVYGRAFTALQLVWPDRDGCYPWDHGYSVDLDAQPLWGVPAHDDAA
ncbi:MAG: DUF4262 domain-containing protein [Gordonia sp. (in: high G+C Gram-positive bacteria)]